ncbi:hypothetical protein LguiB_007026 [Lonicera macranthoides]
MAADLKTLEKRYFDSCRRQGIIANKAVLLALFKAEGKKARNEVCSLVLFLDDLKDVDFHPLLDVFMEIDASEIDAVDILQKSSCFLNGEYVLSLLRAINQKLRVVDLQDMSFGKDFLLNLSQRGLTCQVLNLRSSHFRKLNLVGEFMQIHTLSLDFSASLTTFREDCFTCMPNLKCLSLCETRVANLWTTSAALAKLSSLVQLRFQNYNTDSGHLNSRHLHIEALPFDGEETLNQYLYAEDELTDLFPLDNYDSGHEIQSMLEDSSDDSEVDFSRHHHDFILAELFSDVLPGWNGMVGLQSEISFGTWGMQDEESSSPSSSNSRRISNVAPEKYISYHPSPICYEKHYREYMIASLPSLRILDNLPIRKIDRDRANTIYSQHFEYLPYRRRDKESVVSILHKREIKAGRTCTGAQKPSHASDKSQYFYSRSLCASKVGSSAWPFLRPLSILGSVPRDEGGKFRPRQFEYHPSNPSLLVFGTLDGEVVVVNHESEKIVSYIPSRGAMNSVLGLCWLKNYPSKLIAGSDNGSLKLYDIQYMPSTTTGSVSFDEFDQLTSVHVNSTNDFFLASGYSTHVALYDVSSGKRLQVFTDMHQMHINVVKFANHSPSLFATSSFDKDVKMWDLRQKPIRPCYTASSSRGNVMVCFSPDDHYLLASAVDNEVKQLLAVDGRLHLDFGIAPTRSSQNYTRSYYLNGRDYIISGSCDEHVVRICCAQTGRRLRDISLEVKGSGSSMFVQSLRGDPFREFNMSILATYLRPSSNTEIVKVNMLACSDYDKEYIHNKPTHPFYSMGG